MILRYFPFSWCRIQPVKLTKDKQLKLWKEIILEYHMQNNIFTMNLLTCCLFDNRTIDRRLSPAAIREIVDYLVNCGIFVKLSTQLIFKIFFAMKQEMANGKIHLDRACESCGRLLLLLPPTSTIG